MVRKIKPENLRNDFGVGIDELIAFYDRLRVGQSDKDQSLLAENVILSTAVMWEGFVNDLLIAYINRDSTQFRVHLDNALKESLNAKQTAILGRFGQVSYPNHLTKNEIATIIDDKGNNITFSHFGDLVERSESWLIKAHHDRIKDRTDLQRRTINLLIALRNHIAHRSKRSFDAMNDELARGVLQPTGLKRGLNSVSNVGSYLKSVPVGHQTSRVHILLPAVKAIAGLM